ncbi:MULTISPECIES: hypothetical protein [unclassified Rhodococcus (in: high G+C Gram-positive bacteria)]|uniref:hypothetical protein n=1 Tax=unclassified Rhodococcus (in: high G+C Gram-positive bacteria) TaxID=192944 RepID=UPI00163AA12A|nr:MULTISPECIES: hypothetical protein [unclassified Rhodococcus (in: high G+C Gram-positive bacteria)]MBC2641793.1 hypothetical protein [Rhodococcus sp. 3A]MBC2893462.1 hypothetical protein [Rhodococcus sp. 4CII]
MRGVAVIAVQAALVALVLGNASAVGAAAAGVAATGLLLVAYTGVAPGMPTLLLGAVVAGAAASLAATLPGGPAWSSLLVPGAVVLLFVVAVWPYARRPGPSAEPQNRRML